MPFLPASRQRGRSAKGRKRRQRQTSLSPPPPPELVSPLNSAEPASCAKRRRRRAEDGGGQRFDVSSFAEDVPNAEGLKLEEGSDTAASAEGALVEEDGFDDVQLPLKLKRKKRKVRLKQTYCEQSESDVDVADETEVPFVDISSELIDDEPSEELEWPISDADAEKSVGLCQESPASEDDVESRESGEWETVEAKIDDCLLVLDTFGTRADSAEDEVLDKICAEIGTHALNDGDIPEASLVDEATDGLSHVDDMSNQGKKEREQGQQKEAEMGRDEKSEEEIQKEGKKEKAQAANASTEKQATEQKSAEKTGKATDHEILPDVRTARAHFLRRVLSLKNSKNPPQPLPITFDDGGSYYSIMAAGVLEEARERVSAVAIALAEARSVRVRVFRSAPGERCRGERCDDEIRVAGAEENGLEIFTVRCKGSGQFGESLGRVSSGTLLLLCPNGDDSAGSDLAPLRVICLGRSVDGVLRIACIKRSWVSNLVDEGGYRVRLHATGEDVLGALRVYQVCCRAPLVAILPEILPLFDSSDGGQSGGSRRCAASCSAGTSDVTWQVVADHAVNVFESPEEDAATVGRLMRGRQIPITAVLLNKGVLGYGTDGRRITASSHEATLRWLRLPDDAGWLRDAKVVRDQDGCLSKRILLKPVDEAAAATAAAARTGHTSCGDGEVDVLDDLDRVNPERLDAAMACLHKSQRTAVKGFLQGPRRLHLLQGPPGTGKSHVSLALLRLLACDRATDSGDLILVAAPTNNAVHNLVSTFLAEQAVVNKDSPLRRVRVAFFGVPERMPAAPEGFAQAPVSLHDVFTLNAKTAALERLSAACAFAEEGNIDKATGIVVNLAENLGRRAPNCCRRARLQSIARVLQQSPLTGEEAVSRLRKAETLLGSINCDDIETELLGSCDLLFCTVASAGKPVLRRLAGSRRARWCIVDEAAQSVEAETMLLLDWDPCKMLLVGDPYQLAASVVSRGGTARHFDRSLMGRLFAAGEPYSMLNRQHRMHPDIADFPARHFYKGLLRNAKVVKGMLDGTGGTLTDWDNDFMTLPPYVVIDATDGNEASGPGGSLQNKREVGLCCLLAEQLAQVPEVVGEGSICVLSFYKGQMKAVQDALEAKAAAGNKRLRRLLRRRQIVTHTVDSFQGREAPIVILSCVRSQHLGFLTDFRRLNVALTRAQRRLFVVANVAALSKLKVASGCKVNGGGSGGIPCDGRDDVGPASVAAMLKDAKARELVLDSTVLRAAAATATSQ
eukprot:TRINITY_DN35118_c0_g1_i1.p1 TRINITY_DN35118_c0_g1~~TRINITY_DN35118_c0_g1_i1.p1  ORF type:complete len:1268 (+),score=240.36 TRINITY_DN35118_c0_g1_i1:58-3804(+)